MAATNEADVADDPDPYLPLDVWVKFLNSAETNR